MVDKEIKLFVQEFETSRNDRESEDLKRCIAYAQDAPDKYESGISSLNKKLNDVSEKFSYVFLLKLFSNFPKVKESKPVFENLLAELTELKKQRRDLEDPYFMERREFLKEQERAKDMLDEEFKIKEQELVNKYRLMMEKELRGTYDPIGGQM
ncbi:6416_t:CDS:2 [Acaulospora morrowiae]|uniref:Biogenesis of lysosome-related organelles complex 1 subunit 5 n=1 Tax=Acaulospora morrowiae TaxID=94023 RepID=A0A9N9G6D2_9GLOM|nr:6416_t:CDS:2 [Acaulospora morrowiae]